MTRASRNSDIYRFALNLLTALFDKFDIPDTRSMISDALELINQSKCPWDISNSPISSTKMRERIRYIGNKISGNNLQISSEVKRNFNKLYLLFIQRNDWQFASQLLENTYSNTFMKYKSRLDVRTTELLQNARSSL